MGPVYPYLRETERETTTCSSGPFYHLPENLIKFLEVLASGIGQKSPSIDT